MKTNDLQNEVIHKGRQAFPKKICSFLRIVLRISESLKTKELTSTYAMDTDTLELKQMKNEAHVS